MGKDSFSICLQGVLRFFDDFSKQPVSEGVRILLEEKGKALKKPDGFWVITGEEAPKEVVIESPIYETKRVLLKTEKKNEPLPVWLTPNKNYPFSGTFAFGKIPAAPGEKIFAFCKEAAYPLRLMKDGQKGENTLLLHLEYGGNFDGQHMVIETESKAKKGKLECVKIEKLILEDGSCVLEAPLKQNYIKIKSCLYPLYFGYGDKDGICTIAIKLKEKEGHCVFIDSDGKIVGERDIAAAT